MAEILYTILGLIIILIGLALIFSTISPRKANVESGGFILIGPFPIFFKGKGSRPLLLLFLALTILIFSLFVFLGMVRYV
ncbi:MAG: DUF131 domain-containing protein [Nitrososphaerota archaeon]